MNGLKQRVMSDCGSEPERPRDRQVIAEFGRLEDAIEQLAGMVGALEERLEGVIKSRPPAGGATGDEIIEEVMVPMAYRLRGLRYGALGAAERIGSILDRLEI